MEFVAQPNLLSVDSEFHAEIISDALTGNVISGRTFARLIAPSTDTSALVARLKPNQIPKSALLKGSVALQFDPALVLASLEKDDPKPAIMRDEEVHVVDNREGILELHVENTQVPGTYHLGVYVEVHIVLNIAFRRAVMSTITFMITDTIDISMGMITVSIPLTYHYADLIVA